MSPLKDVDRFEDVCTLASSQGRRGLKIPTLPVMAISCEGKRAMLEVV